jgi:hypothetical protein
MKRERSSAQQGQNGTVTVLRDMSTWTVRRGRLRSFTDDEGHVWIEQNPHKHSPWARLARKGRSVAWEFAAEGGGYTGRMLIDGEITTPSEATRKFLQSSNAFNSGAGGCVQT